MITKKIDKKIFGRFYQPLSKDDPEFSKYIVVHDNPRYETMSNSELVHFLDSTRFGAVRNACVLELAHRLVNIWQDGLVESDSQPST
jgi:hypothetical protein